MSSKQTYNPFNETIEIFCFFHPLAEVDFPPFIDDFHFDTKVILKWQTFISTLVCSPHFFFNGLLGMVYELLQNYFVLNDLMNGFNLFFKVCGRIVRSHFPPLTSHLLFFILILNVGKII
jgi:hypothetical protein